MYQHGEISKRVSPSPILSPLELLAYEGARYIGTMEGHLNFVNDFSIANDENVLFSCSNDLSIKSWNLTTKKEIFSLTGHTESVLSICLTSDNKNIISGSRDSLIKVWSIDSRSELFTLKGHTNSVNSVTITVDGQFIVSCSDDESIIIWDFSNKSKVISIKAHSKAVNKVVLTEENDFIISCSDDGFIKVWNFLTRELEFQFSNIDSVVNAIAIGKGNIIVSGSDDSTVRVWGFQQRAVNFTLKGHTSHVLTVSISKDSKFIASGDSKNVIVWDFNKQYKLYSIPAHTNSVRCLQILSNNTTVISGSVDRTIKIWNLDEKREDFDLDMSESTIRSMRCAPNSQTIVTFSTKSELKVWNCETKALLHTITSHERKICTYCMIKDFIVVGLGDGVIELWRIDTASIYLSNRINEKPINFLVASDNSLLIACSSFDYSISILKSDSLTITKTHKEIRCDIKAMCFNSGNSHLIIASSDNSLKAWKLDTGENFKFTGNASGITCIVGGLNDKHAITGSSSNSIKVWNILTQQEERSLDSHTGKINTLALMPSLNYFASGSDDGMVKIWDLNTFKKVCDIPNNSGVIYSVTVYNNESHLAVAANSQLLKFWRIQKRGSNFFMEGEKSNIPCLAISKNSQLLVGCFFNKKINIWDLLTYKLRHTFWDAHSDNINAVLLASDEKWIISASDDKLIKVWDIQDKKILFQIEHHKMPANCLALTPDEQVIISGSDDKTVIGTDLTTKLIRFTLLGHSSLIYSIALSLDGSILISGSKDKTVKVWNLKNNSINVTLTGHSVEVLCVAITPDNKYAASGSTDKTVRVWNLLAKREEYTINEYKSPIKCLVISPNGKYLIFGCENLSLKIWNLDERHIEFSIENFSKIPRAAKVSFDGSFIVVGTFDEIKGFKMDSIVKHEINKSSNDIYPNKQDWVPRNSFDFYYQKPLDFYNIIDFIKGKDFSILLPSASHTIFSKHCFTLTHLAAYYGDIDYLNAVSNENFIIQCDAYGNSPLFYAIQRNHQHFVDAILYNLISQKEKYSQAQFCVCTYALRNDFLLIIKNSSKYLHEFLNSIMVITYKTSAYISKQLPDYHYNKASLPNILDFTSNQGNLNDFEKPVVLKRILIPFVSKIDSRKSLELIKSIHECKNLEIYRTPFIQYFLELQWRSLRKWSLGYCSLIFFSIVFMLLLIEFSAKNIYALFPFIFVNILLSIWEILQALRDFKAYLEDIINYIDSIKSLLIVLWVFLENIDSGSLYLTWILMLLILLKGLTIFRYFDGLRYYFTLIVRALNDIKYFILIFVYSTTALGIMFMISRRERLSFKNMWRVSYDLNFGNYEADGDSDNITEYVVFVAATFINVVLMLNLLISILGESFAQFKLEEVILDYKGKCEIISEVQQVINWKFIEAETNFLHICDVPFDDNSNKNLENKVEYLAKVIQDHSEKGEIQANRIKEFLSQKSMSMESLEARVTSLETTLNQKIDKVQTNLNQKIDEIQQSLQKIIQGLGK